MAQVNKDVLWSSMFGQYVPIPQHEKADGTMVPTGANNPLPVTGELKLSGSYETLSTEPKPTGKQGDTLLEYNVTTKETKVYKFISGDWREL